MEPVTRNELNGLGERLGDCELLKPTVHRNESDIQKIFEVMEKLPMKIAGLITIPTLLLLYQILIKK